MTAPENTRERLAEALEREYGCKAGYVHEGYGSECASSAHAPALYRTFGCDHVVHVADALLPLIDTLLREQREGIAAEANHRAKVITLCGSTRFKSQFETWNSRLTLDGNVVISVGVFGHGYHPYHREKYLDPKKPMLDRLHRQKIDMADEVFVIDPGGYVGDSTRAEIEYAHSLGKPVRRLSQESPECVECGRDNDNATHEALERTGHLSHPFIARTFGGER